MMGRLGKGNRRNKIRATSVSSLLYVQLKPYLAKPQASRVMQDCSDFSVSLVHTLTSHHPTTLCILLNTMSCVQIPFGTCHMSILSSCRRARRSKGRVGMGFDVSEKSIVSTCVRARLEEMIALG